MKPNERAQYTHDKLFIGYPRTLNGLRAIDEITAS